MWRRGFQTVGNPLIGGSGGSFGISEGNITGRKKTPTEYMPNSNCQQRSSPEACKLWDRQREKKERTFLPKALTRILGHSQNRGFSEDQRRASWLHTGPSPMPEAGVPTARAGRQGDFLAPETGILHQTASRLSVANQVFLSSKTVDICQEGHSMRSAP